jgi:hypothetical protein
VLLYFYFLLPLQRAPTGSLFCANAIAAVYERVVKYGSDFCDFLAVKNIKN